MLKPIWKTPHPSIHTKILKSKVLSMLLHRSEFWKTTTVIMIKLKIIQNNYLRCILKIFWPNTTLNDELQRKTGLDP
jgi:hypothetical protein